MPPMIYLDYQATTPLAPEARAAMLRWLEGPGEGRWLRQSVEHP
jgi:cysteine desulfurase